ncbi:CHY zinc finger protein [Leifsonia sp. NPDC058292]|uniref:CHY zinc finger protein n=1 Tax=Leifsonia sp. NPDC058292 TaxID=3346428 RepID=UPI0036D8DD4D
MLIHGQTIDDQTRCVHYGAAEDVIAIKFHCCDRYYPCHLCHAADADHPAELWPLDERDRPAVVCGVCSSELTVTQYLDVDGCPSCGAAFNPGCKLHTHLYFETA